jgi:hypothetical protein
MYFFFSVTAGTSTLKWPRLLTLPFLLTFATCHVSAESTQAPKLLQYHKIR